MTPILRASTQRQRQIRKPGVRDTLKNRHYQRYVRGYIDHPKSSHSYTRNPERLKCERYTSARYNCKVINSLIIKKTRANRSINSQKSKQCSRQLNQDCKKIQEWGGRFHS